MTGENDYFFDALQEFLAEYNVNRICIQQDRVYVEMYENPDKNSIRYYLVQVPFEFHTDIFDYKPFEESD